MPTVEERLHSAAALLDETLDQRDRSHQAAPARLEVSNPSRRVLVALVAACLVAGLVGLVAIGRPSAEPAASDTPFTPPADMTVDAWVGFPELPIVERFQHAAVATEDGIFVWGGCCEPATRDAPDSTSFHDGAYFDIHDGTWRVLPAAPLAEDRGDAVAAWTGTEVIVVNGSSALRAAAFHPSTFTWTAITPPTGDSAASAVADLYPLPNGRVAFVVTNYEDGLGNGVRIQVYDPTTDNWTAAPDPRDGLSYGVAIPDKIHGSAISGTKIAVASTGTTCGTATLDVYDTTTETWATINDIAYPDVEWTPSAMAGLGDDTFLLIGGPCSASDSQRMAAIIDPTTGSIVAVSDAPVDVRGGSRYPMTWTGEQAIYLSADGRLVMFDPTNSTWTISEPLPRPQQTDLEGPIHDFPIVWLDGTAIAPAVAVGANNVCCTPIRAAWAYRPGWSTSTG